MPQLSDLLAPYRIYLELALVAALLGGFGLFVRYERVIGVQNELAKVAKAVDKQKAVDAKDVSDARLSLAVLQTKLDTVLRAPDPVDPNFHVRVCNSASVIVAAREDASPGSRSNAADQPTAGVEGQGSSVDVTSITEATLLKAGAEIEYLQGYIRTCQDRGFCERE